MRDYIIYTDSSCDLSPDILDKLNVYSSSLSFYFADNHDRGRSELCSATDFYEMMRQGYVAKTSAVNSEGFVQGFEPILKRGIDILYLGMSSALSTTYNSACIAAKELKEKYPCRKIVTVDSLSVSAGLGLLVDCIVQRRADGATIEDAEKYANHLKTDICHYFTVDDLSHLKRGGRINPATAAVGSVLGIKPILHVSTQGELKSNGKARGRRAAINQLASRYETHCTNHKEKIYIAHADCRGDAQQLYKILKERYSAKTISITDIGPAIGAHAGPGTLALFFVGQR